MLSSHGAPSGTSAADYMRRLFRQCKHSELVRIFELSIVWSAFAEVYWATQIYFKERMVQLRSKSEFRKHLNGFHLIKNGISALLSSDHMNRLIGHNRITDSTVNRVSDSLFEFFCESSGGAIQVSSKDFTLTIKGSLFRFCIASNYGGAVYVVGKTISADRTCFYICFNKGTVDTVYGNAIYSRYSGSEERPCMLNRTAFFGCGPSRNSGEDSTVCFERQETEAENTNFTQCCGLGGSSALTVNGKPGKSKYMSTYGGFNWHLTCTFGVVELSLQSVNFINFTQIYKILLYYHVGGNTVITDCAPFVSEMLGKIQNVEFRGNCLSNLEISSCEKTKYTELNLKRYPADMYCQMVHQPNDQEEEEAPHLMLLNLGLLLLPRAGFGEEQINETLQRSDRNKAKTMKFTWWSQSPCSRIDSCSWRHPVKKQLVEKSFGSQLKERISNSKSDISAAHLRHIKWI